MTVNIFLLCFAYLLIVFLGVGLFMLWVEVKAQAKSTHQVTMINPNSDFESVTEKLKERLSRDPFEESGNIM